MEKQIQLQELEWFEDEEDINTMIVRTRNEEMKQLEQDMGSLNDIFRELACLVGEQGEDLNIATKQIDVTAINTEEGVEHLKQAEEYSKVVRSRGWLLKGALAFSGITVGGICLTIISPIGGIFTAGAGIFTAGAGIAGIVSCIGIAIKKNK